MAVDDHPMRALKGTEQARDLMASVRSHKATTPAATSKTPAPTTPPAPASRSYDEIIAAHAARIPKG